MRYRKILSFHFFSVRTSKIINTMFLKSTKCNAYVQLRSTCYYSYIWITMHNWYHSTHEAQTRREWTLHVKGFTFLAFCFSFLVELSTFLLIVICTDNFANTNTTSTNRFIYISKRRYFRYKALFQFSAWHNLEYRYYFQSDAVWLEEQAAFQDNK